MDDTRGEKTWKALKSGPFADRIGPVLALREGDGFAYAIQTDDGHANALGLVHGGVITALLDQALAMVAWQAADRAPTVTVQMDTRFAGPARPGALLEARASLRHRTGSMMFLDATIHEGTRTVALGSAIMKITRKAD